MKNSDADCSDAASPDPSRARAGVRVSEPARGVLLSDAECQAIHDVVTWLSDMASEWEGDPQKLPPERSIKNALLALTDLAGRLPAERRTVFTDGNGGPP